MSCKYTECFHWGNCERSKENILSSDAVLAEVRAILKGIDKTETEDTGGWWETSTGADFGKQKLDEVLQKLSEHFGLT